MLPKYIDIHCHVNFKAFDTNRDEVIKRALDNNVWVINVGTQIDTSKKALEIANQYDEGVYAIVGLHPIHTGASFHDESEIGEGGEEFSSRGEIFNKESYRELLKNKKVIGIGECGLDYYHCSEESVLKQKEVFVAQIEFSNETNKPLMIHVRNNYENKNRDAYADVLELLKQHAKVGGVVHFFESSLENAKKFIELGFFVSFTGVITYPPKKNGQGCDYAKIIKEISLDMILTDTDSPYVAPVPYRGKTNEPLYVKEIVKKIAEIKNMPESEVAGAIIANARRVFTF
ncbi:MAG: TatD family hydrolase [Candidatus Nomurabacteria bacterium]|nr:TatD family hydrolase [Candidatus Nomurabacteria bacterium]